jgi:hypothetical protein
MGRPRSRFRSNSRGKSTAHRVGTKDADGASPSPDPHQSSLTSSQFHLQLPASPNDNLNQRTISSPQLHPCSIKRHRLRYARGLSASHCQVCFSTTRRLHLLSISRSWKNGDFTGLTITCGSLTFNVHTVVVCSVSDFFGKSKKFALGKEAQERCIDLPEDDPEMIRRLIDFAYLGDYAPCGGQDIARFEAVHQDESTATAPTTHHPVMTRPEAPLVGLFNAPVFHLMRTTLSNPSTRTPVQNLRCH